MSEWSSFFVLLLGDWCCLAQLHFPTFAMQQEQQQVHRSETTALIDKVQVVRHVIPTKFVNTRVNQQKTKGYSITTPTVRTRMNIADYNAILDKINNDEESKVEQESKEQDVAVPSQKPFVPVKLYETTQVPISQQPTVHKQKRFNHQTTMKQQKKPSSAPVMKKQPIVTTQQREPQPQPPHSPPQPNKSYPTPHSKPTGISHAKSTTNRHLATTTVQPVEDVEVIRTLSSQINTVVAQAQEQIESATKQYQQLLKETTLNMSGAFGSTLTNAIARIGTSVQQFQQQFQKLQLILVVVVCSVAFHKKQLESTLSDFISQQ